MKVGQWRTGNWIWPFRRMRHLGLIHLCAMWVFQVGRPPLESRVEPLRRPRPPKRVAIDLAGSGTSSGCTDRNYASTWLAIIHLSRPFRADYGNETGRPSLRPTIHLVSHIPAVHRPHPHPFSCSLIEQYFSIQPNSELRQIFLLACEWFPWKMLRMGPVGGN